MNNELTLPNFSFIPFKEGIIIVTQFIQKSRWSKDEMVLRTLLGAVQMYVNNDDKDGNIQTNTTVYKYSISLHTVKKKKSYYSPYLPHAYTQLQYSFLRERNLNFSKRGHFTVPQKNVLLTLKRNI